MKEKEGLSKEIDHIKEMQMKILEPETIRI